LVLREPNVEIQVFNRVFFKVEEFLKLLATERREMATVDHVLERNGVARS
jgi:hypothetical protein